MVDKQPASRRGGGQCTKETKRIRKRQLIPLPQDVSPSSTTSNGNGSLFNALQDIALGYNIPVASSTSTDTVGLPQYSVITAFNTITAPPTANATPLRVSTTPPLPSPSGNTTTSNTPYTLSSANNFANVYSLNVAQITSAAQVLNAEDSSALTIALAFLALTLMLLTGMVLVAFSYCYARHRPRRHGRGGGMKVGEYEDLSRKDSDGSENSTEEDSTESRSDAETEGELMMREAEEAQAPKSTREEKWRPY